MFSEDKSLPFHLRTEGKLFSQEEISSERGQTLFDKKTIKIKYLTTKVCQCMSLLLCQCVRGTIKFLCVAFFILLPKTAKQESLGEKKKMQNVPCDVANHCYVNHCSKKALTINNKKYEKQNEKKKNYRGPSRGPTNVYRATFKKTL